MTRDVPEGALAIARPEQQVKDGYADAVAERYGQPASNARVTRLFASRMGKTTVKRTTVKKTTKKLSPKAAKKPAKKIR